MQRFQPSVIRNHVALRHFSERTLRIPRPIQFPQTWPTSFSDLKRNHSLLQRLHIKLDALVPISSSQPINEPFPPLSSMDELDRYGEGLRDGPRDAQLLSVGLGHDT